MQKAECLLTSTAGAKLQLSLNGSDSQRIIAK